MHSNSEPAEWDKQQRDLGASFLQSALWADFQESIGHRPHFISGAGWSCLLLERQAPIGRYLFAPYGPTVTTAKPSAVFDSIKTYAESQKTDWLRLEPLFKNLALGKQLSAIRSAGGRPSPNEVEPHLTRVIDLTRPEEEILASLSQTTRNIIRRNRREKTLTFKTSRDPADVSLFTEMLDKVARRKGVGFFTADYYHKQAETLMPPGMLVLEIAYDNERPVGTTMIHDFGGLSSYTYAAALPEARDKNVSALLLWQAMVNAKDRGNTAIDLFGIAPDDAGPAHPWSGFSDFKKKFGGQVEERLGTWDIPLTGKYRLYRSALSAKRIIKLR